MKKLFTQRFTLLPLFLLLLTAVACSKSDDAEDVPGIDGGVPPALVATTVVTTVAAVTTTEASRWTSVY